MPNKHKSKKPAKLKIRKTKKEVMDRLLGTDERKYLKFAKVRVS